ncbi:MAG: Ku protein [Bacteroidota bacterium]|nr:Ku protein [Bacteroidota bacterium]
MARALWTGAISFGLVNIPVKLLSAVQDSTLDLDMLDSKDHSNIRFKRVNESTGREVNYNDIVKGYMLNDKYVILKPEDFVNADVEKTKTIDIQNFVNEEEIESIYFEQPYYLQPDKSGEKAYGLLRDALKKSGKVGLATFVLRNKEGLVIIKPYDKVIVLNRIRFQEEIRDIKEIATPAATKAKSPELTMAIKLIDQLTSRFDITKYKDTYTEKLLKIIKAKAKLKGKQKLKIPPTLKVVHTKKDDLMDALKASLSKRKKAS